MVFQLVWHKTRPSCRHLQSVHNHVHFYHAHMQCYTTCRTSTKQHKKSSKRTVTHHQLQLGPLYILLTTIKQGFHWKPFNGGLPLSIRPLAAFSFRLLSLAFALWHSHLLITPLAATYRKIYWNPCLLDSLKQRHWTKHNNGQFSQITQ